MSYEKVEDFNKRRQAGNDLILKHASLQMKRLFNLDASVYKEGALSVKTKELLGLTASLVLRCDDCIAYHIINCYEVKVTTEELVDALTVGYTAAGSITVPHLRRAFMKWAELTGEEIEFS